ncbi:helix-turn-helix domain-containing protein [uncultured Brachyspira sp.]|uniref:AlbA family DNA-binding domain-containing protein n=1 Tax=uncultured Brachyspira sp. TaxID=221953 RepID=UPI0025DCB75F|nr:ATP-binding protein [uncultured Brachyspira sp.]
MKIISGRFLSKTELKNRILRDVVISVLFLSIIILVYMQIRNPIPIRFIFKSLFQDVKTSVVEEYSKIFYPTYYFSMQMTPIFDIVNQAPEAYKILITNFFPKHQFIEKAAMHVGNNYMSITKEEKGYKVVGQIVTTNTESQYSSVPFEQLSIDSFYIKDGKPYIHLIYIANENIAFEYISQFNINFKDIELKNIDNIYAYLVTGNSKITFPISYSHTNNHLENLDYVTIANIMTEEFKGTNEDMIKVLYKDNNYWGYKGSFSVVDNNIEIGIIIPEKALINKIQIPIILFLIIFVIVTIVIIVMLAIHYIRIIEDLKRNHMNIEKLIEEGENTNIEFKSTLRYDSNTEKINKALEEVIMKSIAAFSNTEGGRLFIGISNNGEILGLEHDYSTLKQPNRDFFELHLRTLIETYYGNAFSAEGIRIDFVAEKGKDICIVYISRGREPVYTKITNKQGAKEEKFYIRVGNSSREIANASEIIAYVKKHFK